jgi:hypothetical protein
MAAVYAVIEVQGSPEVTIQFYLHFTLFVFLYVYVADECSGSYET